MTDFRLYGGPTVLFEYGGLRFLTDPTFDAPGDYPRPGGRFLTRTAPPAAGPETLGTIDVVLLSHDEHPDNLDNSGRELLGGVPLVLTTPSAAGRLGGTTRGLQPWEEVHLDGVTVTAVPALHGPQGAEAVMGEVTGFVLTAGGLPTLYVSGDNASLDLVRQIAARFDVDTAVLFAGAVRIGVFDNAVLTLDGSMAAEAAAILGARHVVPAHVDSWKHFTEGREEFVTAFEKAGLAGLLDA
ncbi:MBL fold metallo-hydrolase [Actinoplanes sp. TBRC 11911]|uniref:MBL fold metallo-hydrolase n=1 Tax=Actinoplanes sp. TBRC 11911 TaxID=2729386 RepID=UPI00145D0291|nr:MBL fold metallo-hydrolase [Actinoplanes sp. TBRC 11911]NMO56085.1 MBL fold metallo-hydrolase [Actinoplanes sp. TBRC 11911]